VVAALGAVSWWLRDVPRHQLENAIADRLGADVRIERIEVRSTRRVVLHGVRVEALSAWPWVDRVSIRRVEAVGSPREMLAARFDRLVLGEVVVMLSPRAGGPSAGPAAPADPAAGGPSASAAELVLDGVELRTAAGVESGSVLRAGGVLRDWGGSFHGRLRVSARAASARALSSLTGLDVPDALSATAGTLEGEVLVEAGGRRLTVRAEARKAGVSWDGRPLPVTRVRLAAVVDDALSQGSRTASWRLRLGELGIWRGQVDWRSGKSRPRVRLFAKEVDPGAVLPWLPGPITWGRGGRLRLAASATADGEVRVRAASRLPATSLAAGKTPIDLGTVSARAELRTEWEPDGPPAPVEFVLDAEGARIPGGHVRGRWRPGEEGRPLSVACSFQRTPLARWWRLLQPLGGGSLERAGGWFEGDVALRVRLDGPVSKADWTATAQLREVSASGDGGRPWRLSEGSGDLRARGRLDSRHARFEADLSSRASLADLAPRSLALRGSGTLDAASGRVRVEGARLEGEGLGEVRLGGDWSREGWQLDVHHEEIDLAAWSDWLRPWVEIPDGWQNPRGAVTLQATLEPEAGGFAQARGELRLEQGAWGTHDGTRAFEGLRSSWTWSGELGPERVSVSADGGVTGPLLLWRSTFADLGGLEVRASAALEGPTPGASAGEWRGRAHADLSGVASLEIGASAFAGGGYRLEGRLRSDELGAAYRRLLREPLAEGGAGALPKVNGGSLDAEAQWWQPREGRAVVAGRIRMRDGDVAGADGTWSLSGLGLNLPFELERQPGGFRAGSRQQQGGLAIEEGRVDGLALPAIRSELRVRGARVDVVRPVTVEALGGELVLRGLTLDPGLGGQPLVRAGLDLRGLELRGLSEAVGLPPLEGTLEGGFPSLRLEGSELTVEGGGRIEVFGGRVEIGDIAAEELFSGYPRVSFSAEFAELDLGQLTRTFSFGEMNGVLEGHLRDCVLVGGAPVSFEAELRTVERDGVPRTIGVKAINNLAILGTGGEVSVLDRGLHKFLDTYTYDRLGIRGVLDNDRFLLRGLEHEGDRELFLEGRFPFPIDIVNARPGQTIGFRSMLERLRRIDFSAASTGGGGLD
jgi:hypothetical protein